MGRSFFPRSEVAKSICGHAKRLVIDNGAPWKEIKDITSEMNSAIVFISMSHNQNLTIAKESYQYVVDYTIDAWKLAQYR